MPTLVSTGQITIIDTNDARSITMAVTSDMGVLQTYSKDNDTVTYVPSWFTANASTGLTINVALAVGGLTTGQSWAAMSNKTFSLTAGGAALTTASTSTSFVNDADGALSTPFTVTHAVVGSATPSTLKIKGNLKDTVAFFTLFFDADYTDANTGLVTNVMAQITLNTLKTGSNAVYILTRGNSSIEAATGTVKSVTAIAADLMRTSGIDTTSLTYRWYDTNGATQISTSTASVATKYGMKTTSGSPTAAVGELNVNIPVAGAGNGHNTLVISENAVTDLAIFRVDITDATESKTYSQYFTVYDVSDPYDLRLTSSSGDKLQNGIGSTTITPDVFYGAIRVSPLTGWSFTYYFYDKTGKRGAFVDTAKISVAGGAPVTANTTGASATVTYTGTSFAFAAGDVVKVVKPNGDALFYEVASSTTNIVTIRTPSTNTWLNYTNFPAPSAITDFVGGKLFGCTAQGVRTVSTTPWAITVTGDEIDVKGNIVAEANRP